MMNIICYPDDRLKQTSEKVARFDAELHQFIQELEQTMDAGPGAVGIAAPQTGHLQRIIILDVPVKKKSSSHGRLFLVNPEIIEWQGMEKGREGCLSVPDYTGNVIRAKQIVLTAQDIYGNPLEFEMTGYESRAAQHEIDHLDGFLFLDRLVSRRNDLFKRQTAS